MRKLTNHFTIILIRWCLSKSLYQILLDGVNDETSKEVYDDEMFTKTGCEEIKKN